MLEVLVAAILLASVLTAIAVGFDGSRRLTTVAERRQAAAEMGERELERLISQGYAGLATTSPSPNSSDSNDPRYYVQTSCPSPSMTAPCYQWDQTGSPTTANTGSLVIAAGEQSPGPVPWSAGNLSGNLYRFVTWIDDPCAGCPNTQDQADTTDYKLVTVAVKINGSAAPVRPILMSTVVADPAGKMGA